MDEKRWIDLRWVEFRGRFSRMIGAIEQNLGLLYNPDDMLLEGKELLAQLSKTQKEADGFDIFDATRLNNVEDRAFEALAKALRKAKKWVSMWAGEDWLTALDVPSRMPRSREPLREAARAVLTAWDRNSADPELVQVIPAMDELREAHTSFLSAWDAQQEANQIKKEKYRAAQKARDNCEKFVSRVRKYLSLYLDPYDYHCGVYGFNPRKRRPKKGEK